MCVCITLPCRNLIIFTFIEKRLLFKISSTSKTLLCFCVHIVSQWVSPNKLNCFFLLKKQSIICLITSVCEVGAPVVYYMKHSVIRILMSWVTSSLAQQSVLLYFCFISALYFLQFLQKMRDREIKSFLSENFSFIFKKTRFVRTITEWHNLLRCILFWMWCCQGHHLYRNRKQCFDGLPQGRLLMFTLR